MRRLLIPMAILALAAPAFASGHNRWGSNHGFSTHPKGRGPDVEACVECADRSDRANREGGKGCIDDCP